MRTEVAVLALLSVSLGILVALDAMDPGAHAPAPANGDDATLAASAQIAPVGEYTAGADAGGGPTLCTAVQTYAEVRFLGEWVAYHRLAGMERIVVYAWDPVDAETLLSAARVGADEVALYAAEFSGRLALDQREVELRRKEETLVHCLKEYRAKSPYVVYLDVSEFLLVQEPHSVADLLATRQQHSMLLVVGAEYGSNGLADAPEAGKLVIESFTRRAELNRHSGPIRCLVRGGTDPLKLDPRYTCVRDTPPKSSMLVNPDAVRFNRYVCRAGTFECRRHPGRDWRNKYDERRIFKHLRALHQERGVEPVFADFEHDKSLVHSVVVIGMHRSGTSLVTELLSTIGVRAGPEDMLVRCWNKNSGSSECVTKYNPRGYWENQDLVDIDNWILARGGTKSNKPEEFNLTKVLENPKVMADFRDKAAPVVRYLERAPPFSLKDPRLCLTLPLWAPLLSKSVGLFMFRHPWGVVESLRARDGKTPERSLLNWQIYTEQGLAHAEAAGMPLVYVNTEELMATPLATMQTVHAQLERLGVPMLTPPSGAAVADVYEPEFNHFEAPEEPPDEITPAQWELFSRLQKRAKGDRGGTCDMGAVDVVYTWVNGSNPQHQELVEKLSLQLGAHRLASNARRYRNMDEIKYSLRSLQQYLDRGWVRNVYIVTNGERPSWLNESAASIITHEELFANRSHLPIFNANAFEANLWNLPDRVSECFIYMNDDFLFAEPVTPDVFWAPAPIDHQVLYFHPRIGQFTERQDNPFAASVSHCKSLLDERYGEDPFHLRATQHGVYFMKKQYLREMRAIWPHLHEFSSQSKFRRPHDIALPYLYVHYVRHEHGHEIGPVTLKSAHLTDDYEETRESIRVAKIKTPGRYRPFRCLFDQMGDNADPRVIGELMGWLDEWYPRKSVFEL